MSNWNWKGAGGGAVAGATAGGLAGSVVPGIGTATGAGLGLAGGALFGGFGGEGEKISAQPLIPEWLMDLRKSLPAEFDKLRGLSSLEESSTDLISGLVSSTPALETDLGKASTQELIDILTGTFDPQTDPEAKSLVAAIEREAGLGKRSLRRQAQKSGILQSTPRLLKEARFEDFALGAKGDVLAKLLGKAQDRRLSAAQASLPFLEFGDVSPIRRAAAGFEAGGLSRRIERMILEGKMGVAGMSTPYGIKDLYGPSGGDELLGIGTDLLSAYLKGGGSGAKPKKTSTAKVPTGTTGRT